MLTSLGWTLCIGVPAFICAVCVLIAAISDREDALDTIGMTLLAGAFGGIIGFAFLVIPMDLYNDRHLTTTYTYNQSNIYSVARNNKLDISGSFVLGCGSIHGTTHPSYLFFVERGESKYLLREVNASNYEIVLTDTVSPYVYETYEVTTEPSGKFLKKIFKPRTRRVCDKCQRGTLYLPTNSIVQKYDISL